MEYFPAILIGFFLLVIVTRPFTVLFHELGHAISLIILTKNEATIYIGSYGNKKHSFKVKVGLLEIWFRYNPIKWSGGLCIPRAEDVSINKQIVYILCGPLFSFFMALFFFYLTFSLDLHGSIKLICSFAFGSSIIDLIYNLTPSELKTKEGIIYKSDGKLLISLFKLKRFHSEYIKALEAYDNQEFGNAAKMFESFIERGLLNEDVYRYASTSNIFVKKYEIAYRILKEFENKYQLNADDYYNLGLTSSLLNLNEEKSKYFGQSVSLNPFHSFSLNAIGYEYNNKGEFKEAIKFFDKAIEGKCDFAYAFNNRGLSKIELGELDSGLKDIQYSLELDNNNSYAYRNLGIYHFKRDENEKALKYLLKSKKMDENTDLIEVLITQVEQRLRTEKGERTT